MTERQGVEIDYCPKCRGVWLDRGELEKIIDRSSAPPPMQPPQVAPVREPRYDDRIEYRGHDRDDYRDRRDRDDDDYRYGKHRKRKSWLGEIFDFD